MQTPRDSHVHGRFLLTGDPSRPSRLAVHDLANGGLRVFDDIGQTFDSRERRKFAHVIDPSGPASWSPDGSAVLARFSDPPHVNRYRPMVLDTGSGELVEVADGEPAGFASPGQAVTVRKVGGNDASGGIRTTTTDRVTGETRSLPLRLTSPWIGDPDSNLSASVSPDGSTLLLVEGTAGGSSTAALRLFSLADGSELTPRTIEDWDGCSPAWRGDDPVLPTRSRDGGN